MKLRSKERVIHEEILLHSINGVTVTVNLFGDGGGGSNVKAGGVVSSSEGPEPVDLS